MKRTILILSVGGALFAGYLSGVKLLSNTCALKESCPFFLGYPSCYYGFVMYVALAVLAYLLVSSRLKINQALNWIMVVSGLGMIFAGYFSYTELPVWMTSGTTAYSLGVPSCFIGLLFYIAIFFMALSEKSKV